MTILLKLKKNSTKVTLKLIVDVALKPIFLQKTTPEIQNEIFSLITKNNDLENLELLGKRKSIQDVPSYQSYGTASTTSSLPDFSGMKGCCAKFFLWTIR
ncbi:unnamed protein product [Rhizophagus irregularis]|nr:unnamed protein product [Rhizophagus irregularis]